MREDEIFATVDVLEADRGIARKAFDDRPIGLIELLGQRNDRG